MSQLKKRRLITVTKICLFLQEQRLTRGAIEGFVIDLHCFAVCDASGLPEFLGKAVGTHAKHAEAQLDREAKQGQEAEVLESTTHALGRISSGVPDGIDHSSRQVDHSANSGSFRTLQPAKKQNHEELGIVLQEVLVRSLDAVEDNVCVRVHGRVLDIVLLPCPADLKGEPNVNQRRTNADQNHVAVLLGHDQTHGAHDESGLTLK